MPTTPIRQSMFTTGEVDIQVWKRSDTQEYLTAAQSLLNLEVGTTGLAKKRKGTTLLYNVTGYAQFNSHMYEFIDELGNYYVVLSAENYFYVFSTPATQEDVVDGNGDNVVTNTGDTVIAFANGLTFVQAVPTPYQTGDLDNIDYTQDNDSLVLANPSYAPGRLYISQYNGSAFPTFAFQYLDIYPQPAYDFNTINYNSFTVSLSASSTVLTFEFTGLSSDPGFNDAWIGGQILGGGTSVTQPVGYAIITAVSYSGGVTTFTATLQLPFQTSGYATQGSQYSIRQPAWSATLGYPAAVLFFQNRLWFANTQTLRNTVFGSKINQPISFDVGTGADTDAIIYTLGQTGAGAINWMNGGKQLEIYCENFEFACPQDVNTALTPSTFSIRQQSSYGSDVSLKPVTYINDSYFSTKTGKALINFHFNGIGLTYVSSNISVASSHLVLQPTNRALLRGTDNSQDNFIYFLNPSNDTLTAFQFATEYKLAALTPVKFQENVQIIDICTVENVIYILKYYMLTQQYTIEAIDESAKVDCLQSGSMDSTGLVTGLSLLNGYTVQIVFNDQDFGQYLVQNGQVTVYNPDGYSGAVIVGLLYNVNLTTMYMYGGANASPFMKQITRAYVDYYNSLNFYVNGNLVPYQTYAEIQAGLPLVPQTGTAIVDFSQGYDRFQTFSITQSSPFDLQILSIEYQIDTVVI